MKAVFIVLVVLAVAIAGLGFYRGWFRFSTDNTDPNQPNATMTIDKDKMGADKQKVQGLGHKGTGKADGPAEAADSESRP